jgi:hypothetical protein
MPQRGQSCDLFAKFDAVRQLSLSAYAGNRFVATSIGKSVVFGGKRPATVPLLFHIAHG